MRTYEQIHRDNVRTALSGFLTAAGIVTLAGSAVVGACLIDDLRGGDLAERLAKNIGIPINSSLHRPAKTPGSRLPSPTRAP
jgi:hypothetical protein